jgi:hypothetical protein
VFDFPSKKINCKGVVVGKFRKSKRNILLSIALDIFLLYFIVYSVFFDIKKKKKFTLLIFISRARKNMLWKI